MLSATRYRAAAEIGRQSQLALEMAKLQQSISTEKRLTKASDDPIAAARITEIRQMQADQRVWNSNITTGAAIAASADTKLADIADLLGRAKELVLSGRNDSTSATDRSAIALSLRALVDDLDNAALSTDPTGETLFPDGTPLDIPVSASLRLPATASRASVFDGVSTADGAKTLQQILTDAADAIVGADPATRGTDVTSAISALDAGIGHVIRARTDQGNRAARFDDAADALEAVTLQHKEERSLLEDTDLTYALSALQQKELSLQAAQAVFAQSMKTTLFDLLG
jgi:flagellar hook-associated protein 3 FlgL